MKKVIFLKVGLYILLLFPVVGIAQGYQNYSPPGSIEINKVVFTGKVTDGRTGEALAGASVYIADLKTGAVTNNEGNFLISNISPGRHLIEVSFVGYSYTVIPGRREAVNPESISPPVMRPVGFRVWPFGPRNDGERTTSLAARAMAAAPRAGPRRSWPCRARRCRRSGGRRSARRSESLLRRNRH